MQKNLKRWFPVFTLPTVIAFLIAFLIPLIIGVYLSFCSFTNVSDAVFVGFDNYKRVFTDSKDFMNALKFTVKFALVAVVSINVIAFSLALLLTKGIKGTNFFRTVFFMPNLIGGIVLGYIWQLLINGVLIRFGYSITSNANFGYFGLLFLTNWQMIGYMMIIYIAGIGNISQSVLEAAKVDGAGFFLTLRKVIIPSVMPSITICLFLSLTNSFKMFDPNLALTAGAPSKQTQMLALDIYNTFYGRTGFEGTGQAKAMIFSVLLASIALLQLYLTRRKEVESI